MGICKNRATGLNTPWHKPDAGNPGTPISRLATCKTPVGRLAFPGDITEILRPSESFSRRNQHQNCSALVRAAKYFCFREKPEQLGIEFVLFDRHLQYVQRALRSHRLFIGPVGSRECVEYVANRHDLRLHRYFIGLQSVWVACAV